MATRRRKAAPEPEVTEVDAFEELEELEDVDTDDAVEEEEAPKPRRSRKAAPAKKAAKAAPAPVEEDDEPSGPTYNTAWLAEHVTEVTGVDIDSRSLRMVLRKMAANDELERVVGEDRSRYTFPKGPNDPTVKAVVRAIKNGAAPTRRESTGEEDTPKPRKAAAKETKAAPAKKTTGKKAAPAKATPAKAAPSGRRRRAASAE